MIHTQFLIDNEMRLLNYKYMHTYKTNAACSDIELESLE